MNQHNPKPKAPLFSRPLAALVVKQVTRHPARTALTVLGIAIAMFLFTAVQAMQRGVAEATQASADDTVLVVYRKDRFCPATSVLPQNYQRQIEDIQGVVNAVPVKVVVSNCRTSLDVVTFRGVPKDDFLRDRPNLEVTQGSIEDWHARSDAVLLGEQLADRRRLRPGDTFDAAGIRAYVAGVFKSDEPQDRNVAYGSLDWVQLASNKGQGIVTQFNVRVTDASMLEPVAHAIDARFATAQEPTVTATEQAFVGKIASDVVELVNFARWLGFGCLAAVLALVGNAIVLSVQSRIAEHAVLQTLGFAPGLVGRLVVAEGVLLSLLGGALGATAAVAAAYLGDFALSVEGQTIGVTADPALLAVGLAVCTTLGVLAGLAPAWRVSRREIAECFRAV